MKKIVLFVVAAVFLLANAAMADSIAGKVGVSARGGASYIFNSEWTDEQLATMVGVNKDLKPNIGWTGDGGLIYGITDNLAVNFDVIYLQTTLKYSDTTQEVNFATGKTVDFSLGAQWRFIPKSRFVPYIGAGVDVLWNKADLHNDYLTLNPTFTGSLDVATTYGGHLSVGGDFFITPNIALNAEVRGLYSTKGDITYKQAGLVDAKYARYNPTNVSGFLGIAFYFGGANETPQPIAKEVVPEPAPAPAPPPPAPEPAPAPAPPPPPPPPPPVEEIKKAPEAAAVVEPIIEKGKITLNVEFDTGKSIVKPVYYKEIEKIADIMKKYPELTVVIEGHTDNLGGKKYNLNLSQKRTEAIKMVLVKKFKIESARITPKGFGFSKPIADNLTKERRKSKQIVEYAFVPRELALSGGREMKLIGIKSGDLEYGDIVHKGDIIICGKDMPPALGDLCLKVEGGQMVIAPYRKKEDVFALIIQVVRVVKYMN